MFFLFHAVFIDFARVKLAERESEGAVKTAARSMLSYFDPEMQNYGLFGFNLPAADSEQLFAKVLKENLAVPGGFQYIDVRPEAKNPSITPVYSLANHTVFKRQVLEEMKYKAPIQFSLEIADKFKKTGLDKSMQRASVFFPPMRQSCRSCLIRGTSSSAPPGIKRSRWSIKPISIMTITISGSMN